MRTVRVVTIPDSSSGESHEEEVEQAFEKGFEQGYKKALEEHGITRREYKDAATSERIKI